MSVWTIRSLAVLQLLVFAAGGAWAAASAETASAEGAEREAAPARYVPPKLGSPDHRVSGATRGAETMQLVALAPPDVGFTAREQPRLYWYNSLPLQAGASLVIVDDLSDRVVLRAAIPGTLPAGINSFPLTGTRGRISGEGTYRWSLTVPAPAQGTAGTLVTGGLIERVKRPAPSLWYDEVDSISQSIRQAPGDRALHQTRSALLERAGLTEIAAYDRASTR